MRIGLLGPLEVYADTGTPVDVGGARLRTLLVRLALEPGRVVTTGALIDAVWADEPPAGAANALQALVSRLRRALPAGVVASHPHGYALAVTPETVDVHRFELLVARGRADLGADPPAAAAALGEALALWRGPALVDAAGADFARAPVARLAELRLAAIEDRIAAELAAGGGEAFVAELESLVAAHPLRERLTALLMRALCAAGRPAEALVAFERTRAALAETLGTGPSAELKAAHLAALRGEWAPGSTAGSALDTHAPFGAGRSAPDATVQAPGRSAPDQVAGVPSGTGGRDARDPEAVRGGTTRRTNLPAALTSFVGRDDDLARVAELVGESRLTTLTGPGGAGKTRLAIESSRAVAGGLPDGVWLVELAPVTEPADVPHAVLSVLGLREHGLLGPHGRRGGGDGADPTQRLVHRLGAWRALLVLDNCEHVVGAAARLADTLLAQCPQLRILATSREPLAITGEVRWAVEPLAVPPPDADAAGAAGYAAPRLFADRAAAVRPGFRVDAGNAGAVVRVCRALDGMPLAIELAAAQSRALTPDQLAARLDDRFGLLAGGSRTLPRHRTLRAVVDWSWDLLDDAERALWRRLAVFAGGTTLEMAERVCAGGELPAGEVFRRLVGLVDKSLLVAAGDGRYRMLETIRAYGLERLDESGEQESVRRSHAQALLALAEAADPALRTGEQLGWLARLSAEHDNLHAALRWAIGSGEAAVAVRFAASLGWYWWLSGHRAEGTELAEQAVDVPGERPAGEAATAHGFAALNALGGSHQLDRAQRHLTAARRLAGRAGAGHPLLRLIPPMADLFTDGGDARALAGFAPLFTDDDPWTRATAQLMHAHAELNVGRPAGPARRQLLAALADFRAVGERWGISSSLYALGELTSRQGDFAGAAAYLAEAVAQIGPLGTDDELPQMLIRLVRMHWLLGDRDRARELLDEAGRVARRVRLDECLAAVAYETAELLRAEGRYAMARSRLQRTVALIGERTVAPQWLSMISGSFGYLATAEGDLARARAHHTEALNTALTWYDAPVVGQVLVGLADLALALDRPAGAAELLGAAVAVRGGPDHSVLDIDRVTAAARDALGEVAFAEAYARGRATDPASLRETVRVTLGA